MMLFVLFCVVLLLKLIDFFGFDLWLLIDDFLVSDVVVIVCKLMGYYLYFCRYGIV